MEIISADKIYPRNSNHYSHPDQFSEFIYNFKKLRRFIHGSASCITFESSYPALANIHVSDFHLLNTDKTSFAASSYDNFLPSS